MDLNYLILVKNEQKMQGINVVLSAEYQEGTLPERVSISGGGQAENGNLPSYYATVSAVYNVTEHRFDTCNCVNLPCRFMQELETAADAIYQAIVKKNGGEG